MLFGFAWCSLGNICLRLFARNTALIQRTHLQHNPSLWVQETEAKTHTTASESDHYLTATSLLLLTLEWNLLCYGACLHTAQTNSHKRLQHKILHSWWTCPVGVTSAYFLQLGVGVCWGSVQAPWMIKLNLLEKCYLGPKPFWFL